MRILLSCDYPFHCSGLSTLAESTFKGLTELGHEVVPHSLFDYHGTEHLLKTEKFDLSLGIGYWANAVTQIELPKRYGVKSAVYWVSEATVAKYQDIIPQADLLLTTSNYSTKVFQRDVSDSNPKTLYIGCDTEFYKPVKDFKPSKIFSTFISSGDVKGAEEVLLAINILKPKQIDFKYIVHSPFAYDYKLERDYILRLQKLVTYYKLNNNISLLAGQKIPLEKMPSLYSSMNFYMLSARMGCFCIPIIEAGACEVPCIAGDWEPMSEIIEDGKTGILVPHMAKAIVPKFQEGVWYTEEYKMIDSEILAKKIEYILNNPEERNKMGKEMRKVVEEKFNIKKQTKKLEEELLKL